MKETNKNDKVKSKNIKKTALNIIGNEKWKDITIPIFLIFLSFFAASIIIIILGKNPIGAFYNLLQGAGIIPKPSYAGYKSMLTDFLTLLNYMTPMIFASLAGLKMDISIGFILAIILAIVLKYFLDKSRMGFEIKAVGSNSKGASYAGINVGKTMVLTMVLSGALAGLAGVTYYLGYFASIQPRVLPTMGFNAIAVALLGNINPYGIIASSFIISIIDKGSTYMSSIAGVRQEIASVITGLILLFSALFVVLIAHFFEIPTQKLLYLALFLAMVGGILFSLLHAILCIYFKANQVISGVVINILSMALTVFLTTQINSVVFGAMSDKFQIGTSTRFTIGGLSEIPIIGSAFKNIYPFEVVILIIAIFASYVLNKTKFGLSLRACGDNPHAVDAAGVEVSRVQILAVMVSGALSGLGGISFAYSISTNFSPAIYMGYGYLAIAALIFGNWNVLPTLGACLLFGFARSGGYYIAHILKMPSTFSDLIMILPYVLTLLLLMFFSKTNRAPRALGEIYDKGKR